MFSKWGILFIVGILFSIKIYADNTLVVKPSGAGTIYSTGSGAYTALAIPYSSYRFVKWEFTGVDGRILLSSTDNPVHYGYNLSSCKLIAYFELDQSFLITFVNYDWSVLQSEYVDYGVVPEYKGTEPTKPSDAQFTYTFAGWNKEVVAVAGNATYTAIYTPTVNQYTVSFKNEDGTVLDNRKWDYGTTPSYEEDAPTKPDDAIYTYTFAGWDKEITAVTGETTYVATFTATVKENTYIIHVNQDCTSYMEEQQ